MERLAKAAAENKVLVRNQRFSNWRRRLRDHWQLYLLLLPAFAYILIFCYGPMYGVQIAFKNYRTSLGIWSSPWVGLEHLYRFINYPDFWKIIRNTLVISLYSLATFPCSIVLALLINEIERAAFKRTVQMITYAPHFISTVVVCSMILLFLNRSTGMVNNLIVFLGLERVSFMTIPKWFPTIYVWSGVWQGVGWGTIIYLAALSGVSPEHIEAARVDGASRLQIIRHVNLPAIAPTIITMLILSCGGILSVGFEKIYLLQNPLNLDASQVISTYVYQVGLQGGQFSYSSAIGLFNTLVNIVILIMINQIVKRATGVSIW